MSSNLRVKEKIGNMEINVSGSEDFVKENVKEFHALAKELNGNALVCENGDTVESTLFPVVTTITNFPDAWEEIVQNIRNDRLHVAVGDFVTTKLKNGEEVDLVITEITDEHIRFESRDCVGGKEVCWNEIRSSEGGFKNADICTYLHETILPLLPDELQNLIVPAKRKYKSDGETKEYSSKLFLPAASEVFAEDDCYGDEGLYEQMEYYKDRRHRMKGEGKGKDTGAWWLASVHSGSSTYACYVNSNGSANCAPVNYPFFGVPVCFLISKS